MSIQKSGPNTQRRRRFRPDRSIAARRDSCFGSIAASPGKLTPVYSSPNQKPRCFANEHRRSKEKVFVIPNGVDSTYFSPENAGLEPKLRGTPVIVFTGQMDYRPNVDAVVWFSDTVLPKLRDRFPNTTFVIVGARPSAAVRALGHRPGIVVTGTVPDVRPYVGYADVVVAPLRIGRGIQNKVLEGMAMARPVIVTPQALEGIDAVPDTHLLLARDSDGFVRNVEKIMDPAFANAVGAAARQRVLELYNWADNLAKYDRLLGATG